MIRRSAGRDNCPHQIKGNNCVWIHHENTSAGKFDQSRC